MSLNVSAETLKTERDRYVAFAFAASDILIEINANGNMLYIDGATLGLLGKKTIELQGRPFKDLLAEESLEAMDVIIESLSQQHRVEDIPITFNKKDNATVTLKVSAFKAASFSNHTYIGISVPRNDWDSTSEVFRRDLYSGLLKKEGFVEDANKRIQEATAEGKDTTLTLLDFPELKALLDELPADQATHLLAEISDYLRSKSLDGDTAGMIEDGAYSLVHDGSINETEMMEELLAITKRLDPKGKGAQPTIKSVDTDTGKLTEQDSAQALLYTINNFAEERGEDFSIESLAESYGEMLEDTVEKISSFREAVELDKFDIAFQPIVDIKKGFIHHYECLVRLQDNEEFANPYQFITFGEQANLISEFDLAMTQKVLEILEEAAKKGNRPQVAVNLSGKSLSSTLFMDAFEELLKRKSNVRKQVIVEVTESCKITDTALANDFIQRLRKDGNLCCLDDFGTGESSFDYLRCFQVDFIKIDGSYVRESMKTLRGRQMLRAMAGLCQSLNVQAIGEMVEDHKEAGLLWDCGIKFGQGYLFGKPTIGIETLKDYGKASPLYKSTIRARRFRTEEEQKKRWKKT